MIIARDIMETEVVTIGAGEPLINLYRVLLREDISGVPVLDDRGGVVGVVSARDLLETTEEERDAARRELDYYSGDSSLGHCEWLADVEEFEDRLSLRSVSEVMTAEVIAVPPHAPVPEIADRILQNRIHRVLVIDEEADEDPLVGLISLFDLVGLLR